MNLKERLEECERNADISRNRYCDEIAKLREENQLLKEELRHYEVAVSAVKWMWDKANQQAPFQL